MKSAGKARNNGLYRHIRTSKEIIRTLLNDFFKIHYSLLIPFTEHNTFSFIKVYVISVEQHHFSDTHTC